MKMLKILGVIWAWLMLMLVVVMMFSLAYDFTEPVNCFTDSENLRYFLLGIFGYMFWSTLGLGGTVLAVDLICHTLRGA